MSLANRIINWAVNREPDQVIGVDYLFRWFVIPRNPLFNIYVHGYVGSDDDRALHDHPWPSLSLLVEGELIEVTEQEHSGKPTAWRTIRPGQWVYRRPTFKHRLELLTPTAWTLFITGPRIRQWGFYCPQGWVPWRDFVDPDNPGQIGRGCGDG